MKILKLLLILSCICFVDVIHAQQINFGQYGNYTLTIGELNSNDLDFGIVIRNGGVYNVDINNSKIISLTGVEYLDVIIDVTAQDELYLNGNPGNAGDPQKSIPFTLQAAYANNSSIPTIGKAQFINVSGNTFLQQLPLLERQSQPPGPPPPPPTNAFDQSQVEETAYLYLYGFINVGNINAGIYFSDITITINYD